MRNHTSTVKIVALLLNADESDDIRAAIITAIIVPTSPTGSKFNTSLQKINERLKNCTTANLNGQTKGFHLKIELQCALTLNSTIILTVSHAQEEWLK